MAGPGGPATLRPRVLGGLVVIWVLLAFLPVVWNDFVNWDDYRMFLDNPTHQGSWAARLRGAWASHLLGEYMPVTWMSYALDRSLWDGDASGYHLTSLLLHVVTALLVLALARRLLAHALGAGPDGGDAALSGRRHHRGPRLRGAPPQGGGGGMGQRPRHRSRRAAPGGLGARLRIGWERGRAAGRVSGTWLVGALLLFAASLLARATGLVLPARAGGAGRLSAPAARRRARAVAGARGAARLGREGFPSGAHALAVPMGFLARGDEAGDFCALG